MTWYKYRKRFDKIDKLTIKNLNYQVLKRYVYNKIGIFSDNLIKKRIDNQNNKKLKEIFYVLFLIKMVLRNTLTHMYQIKEYF